MTLPPPPSGLPTAPPRRHDRPGMSTGPLGTGFLDVDVAVSSSFAHDRGTVTSVNEVSVGGKACAPQDVIKCMVAHRKGWTTAGGSSDAEVVATLTAFKNAWFGLLEDKPRMNDEKVPSYHAMAFNGTYHPPRVELYTLATGEKLVVHSYFASWDGGNHGQQFAHRVEAYRVSDGSVFEVAPPRDDDVLAVPAPSAAVATAPGTKPLPRPYRMRTY